MEAKQMGIDWEEILGADGEDLDRAYNDAIPDWTYEPYKSFDGEDVWEEDEQESGDIPPAESEQDDEETEPGTGD